MKKLLLGSFLFVSTVHAQVSGDVTQLNGSVVKADQLTKTIQHIIDTGHVTGLSVAVIHHDKMVYQHSFGIRNMNTRQPMGCADNSICRFFYQARVLLYFFTACR